jgi:hypothetical protein
VAPSANTLIEKLCYIGTVFIHFFFGFIDNIIIEENFIFLKIFHIKIFHKISLIVCGLMVMDKLFISHRWYVGLVLFSTLYIDIGK